MRCFFGIGLSPAVVSCVSVVREAVVDADGSWATEKWVKPQNLHVTVRFLGEVSSVALWALQESASGPIEECGPFDFVLGRLSARPSPRRCRMLWIHLGEGREPFASLVAAIDRGSEVAGLEVDPKPQSPHLTLCRTRRVRAISAATLDGINSRLMCGETIMSVPSVSLIASRLAPMGPEYQVIRTWCLRGE